MAELIINEVVESQPETKSTEETNNSEQAKTETNNPNPEDVKLDKFKLLAKQSHKAQQKYSELNKLKAELQSQAKEMQEFQKKMELFKTNPIAAALQESGKSWDEVLDLYLKNPTTAQPVEKDPVKLLEKQYAEIKAKLDAEEKAKVEAEKERLKQEQQAQVDQVLNDYVKDAAQIVGKDPNKYQFLLAKEAEATKYFKQELLHRVEKFQMDPDQEMISSILEGLNNYYQEEANSYSKLFSPKQEQKTNQSNNESFDLKEYVRQKREENQSQKQTVTVSKPKTEYSSNDDKIDQMVSRLTPELRKKLWG